MLIIVRYDMNTTHIEVEIVADCYISAINISTDDTLTARWDIDSCSNYQRVISQ